MGEGLGADVIDYVMLMNLKRRDDKWHFAQGHLDALDYPLDKVIRFESYDGMAFDSVADIVEAAVADGFSYFRKYSEDREIDDRAPVRKAQLCWFWTYVSALRKIVEMNKHVLLFIDDCLPRRSWDYKRLSKLTDECEDVCKKEGATFKVLQLTDECSASVHLPDIAYYSSMLRKGLYGLNEGGYVFSRSGARLFLKLYEDIFPKEIIFIGEHISKRGLTNKKFEDGFWTAIDPVFNYHYPDWSNSDLWGLR